MNIVNFEVMDGIAILKLNRPSALNAFNIELLKAFLGQIEQIKKDVHVLIITGEGSKAFSAGADIKVMANTPPSKIREFARLGQNIARTLEESPLITIAALNGYALGAGLEIAMACDFIYAAESAKMGLPEVKIGLIPGFGGIQRLSRAIGKRKAKELILTGRMLTAVEALKYGLVNHVSHDLELMNDCLSVAKQIVKNSAFATLQIKKVIDRGFDAPHHLGFELEVDGFERCFTEGDGYREMQKFLKEHP